MFSITNRVCRKTNGHYITLDYEMNEAEFESKQVPARFLSSETSKSALEPTKPPVQWVSGASAWDRTVAA